jgi:peptidyl-prolyl cis-trans isomerase C
VNETYVTDDEIRSAYEAYAKNWTGEEYDLRHILVNTHEDAVSALKRIHEGESFAQVAATVSIYPGTRDIGGELGWSLPIFFAPEFTQVMVSLAPNGLTPEPVKTRFGWHIIELKATRKAEPPPFETVKNELERQLKVRKNTNP